MEIYTLSNLTMREKNVKIEKFKKAISWAWEWKFGCIALKKNVQKEKLHKNAIILASY